MAGRRSAYCETHDARNAFMPHRLLGGDVKMGTVWFYCGPQAVYKFSAIADDDSDPVWRYMAQKVEVETQVTRNGWGDRSKAGIGCRDKSGYGSMPSEMPDCRCGGAARGVTGWQPENDRTSAQAPSNRRGVEALKGTPEWSRAMRKHRTMPYECLQP